MPNYKITSSVREDIERHARDLLTRRIDHAESAFPLSHEQIQNIVCPATHVDMCRELEASEFQVDSKTDQVPLMIKESPRVPRALVVRTILPTLVYRSGDKGGYYSSGNFENSDNVWVVSADDIGTDAMDELECWSNTLVREIRQRELAMSTVVAVCSHVETYAHAVAMWPFLGSLAKISMHVNRFRNHCKVTSRHAPTALAMQTYGARMRAAEVVLTGAIMLPEYQRDDSKIRAIYQDHRKLGTDNF